jgi:ferric-dicitrate binding protein FerR (iron transport regulator)
MCPSDGDLLRLLGKELDESQTATLQAHVRNCDHCQRRFMEYQLVWETLGLIDAPPPKRDFAAAIIAASSRRNWSSSVARFAAAVLLAVGAGVALGMATPVKTPRATVQASDPDSAINVLGLDVLAADATGLDALLTSPQDLKEEEPS